MPTSLTNVFVSAAYNQLLHVDGGVTGDEKTIHDGDGTPTALKVGTQSASVDNIQIDGNTIRSTNPNGDINIEPDGNGVTRLKRLNVTGGIVADTFSITGGGSFLGIEGIASTAEAQAGTNNSKVITPLRLREGLVPMVASTTETLDGTNNTKFITPLRLQEKFNSISAAGSIRAWVNFDGFTGVIRAAGNVSSITKHGTAMYTVNFATAMPDVNYSFFITTRVDYDMNLWGHISYSAIPTLTSLYFIGAVAATNFFLDTNIISVVIIR